MKDYECEQGYEINEDSIRAISLPQSQKIKSKQSLYLQQFEMDELQDQETNFLSEQFSQVTNIYVSQKKKFISHLKLTPTKNIQGQIISNLENNILQQKVTLSSLQENLSNGQNDFNRNTKKVEDQNQFESIQNLSLGSLKIYPSILKDSSFVFNNSDLIHVQSAKKVRFGLTQAQYDILDKTTKC